MPIIILRQDQGNTEPRSANVTVKNEGLSNIDLDNNINNINNAVERNSGNIEIVFDRVNDAYDEANTKLSMSGGTVSGDVLILGGLSANTVIGKIDAGTF